jgi:hypothetical protein
VTSGQPAPGLPSAAPSPAAARAQRRLRVLVVVGGALVVVGLLATLVLVGEFLLDLPTPGTWAYGIAMLAPVGFALLLVGLLGVALARRRDALDAPAERSSPSG